MNRDELIDWLSLNLTPDQWLITSNPMQKLPPTFAWRNDPHVNEWVVASPADFIVTKGDVWGDASYVPETNFSDTPTDGIDTSLLRPTIRQDVLEDAMACVLKDRDDQYGEPEDSFGKIAEYWSAYLESDVSARDVGLMLALMKIARMRNSDKRDNFIDLAGYAACAAECKYG